MKWNLYYVDKENVRHVCFVIRQPSDIPKLYINRREAMEHRCDPSQDPEYKHSIFTQIYEGLKPRDRFTKPLDYR